MNDEDRKRLTEFLGEKPRRGLNMYSEMVDSFRTFSTEADMMAPYKRLHEAGKWGEFTRFMMDKTPYKYYNFPYEYVYRFAAWLFCLSGEGYEERCQMVNDFLEAAEEEGGKG